MVIGCMLLSAAATGHMAGPAEPHHVFGAAACQPAPSCSAKGQPDSLLCCCRCPEEGGSASASTLGQLNGTWRLVYSSGFASGSLGGLRPGPPAALVPVTLGQVRGWHPSWRVWHSFPLSPSNSCPGKGTDYWLRVPVTLCRCGNFSPWGRCVGSCLGLAAVPALPGRCL